MPQVEIIKHINAQPENVWNFISDIRRGPEWVAVMENVLYVSDEPLKQGSSYREESEIAGSTSETEWHITEFDPPHRQVHKTDETMLRATLIMEVSPENNGTKFLHCTEFKMMPRFRPLGWVVEKLVGYRTMSKKLKETVDNVKRIIESEQRAF